MKYSVSGFLSRVIRSRLGYIFTVLNIAVFSFIFWERGFVSALHPFNESFLTQFFLFFNLPSLVIGGLFLIPSSFFLLGINPNETNIALQWLFWFFSIWLQWQLIGYWIQTFLLNKFNPISEKFD